MSATPPQQTFVNIDMQDLIVLMASEVARKVTDELRQSEIVPLTNRVLELEKKMASPSTSSMTILKLRGAGEAIWKIGVVFVALAQLYKLFHP